jgi:uncharacterized protein (DUF488 family)
MNLYTIGFTKKNASQFFGILKAHNIDLLIDVRLNNKSQLAGFTKSDDLSYFLNQICGTAYIQEPEFAPTKEILNAYRDNEIQWSEYEEQYAELIRNRDEQNRICQNFAEVYAQYHNIALLCSEPTPDRCHRRLAAEAICKANKDICLEHL